MAATMLEVRQVQNFKKRKFTDKSLPTALHSAEFAESNFYQQLLDAEKKLDWTMTRKRMEIQDALGKPNPATRTLRIFLSHTVSDQAWQNGGNPSAEQPNFETGQNIPSWALKIEGRLLETASRTKDKAPQKPFSSVVKNLIVDLERDPELYPDGNTVEWRRPQAVPPNTPAPLDGFTVRRTGDSPTKVRVMLYLEQYPDNFKVQPALASIIDVKEESRLGIVTALWNYIKINNLQDKVDRRVIRLDDKLKALFKHEAIHFQQLPELVNHFVLPAEPIIIFYHIKPNEPPPPSPQAYDVEVRVEDTSLKGRMNQVLVSSTSETVRSIVKNDEECALLAQQLQNSVLKKTFLDAFEEDPAGFINKWLASQSRDLESVLAAGPSEGLTVREEELKRSEFFKLPWVEEAVAVQEGMRLAQRSHTLS